ncbi:MULTISPECIES: TPR end-of-group domain-containing protein [Neisseria]|nr:MULTISPECIES: hypothetical protein [Neisseria]KPN74017.1 hypothetical protein AKG43_04925 [Neisseria sp. 74A18]UOO84671.1 hypothetical protein LVJ88_01265 [Neisseria dumasiana]
MNKRILISSLTCLIFGLMFSFSAAANTSVQSNHTAANNPAIETPAESIKTSDIIGKNDLKELELKLQEKILATDQKVVENQQETINWWLSFIAIFAAIVGIAIPYMVSRREKEKMLAESTAILNQAKEHSEKAQTLAAQAKESASNAQAHLDEIQSFHSQAKESTNEIAKLSEQMKKYSSQAQDKESKQQKESIEAAKDLAEHNDIPLIEQLRAQAILLSDKADQSKIYQDYLQAFYAWQAVLQQDNQDGHANFNAGLQACFLYDKSNRDQQAYWFKESDEHYKKVLQVNPASDESAENMGTLFHKEASTLLQEKKIDEAKKQWEQAEKYYQYALAVNHKSYLTVKNWLILLLYKHLHLKTDELQQARYLIDKFLNDYPQFENELAYINACLYALEGNTSEAIAQLRLARQENDLPEIANIKEGEVFNNIRNTPEFQAWFKEAFPESSAES